MTFEEANIIVRKGNEIETFGITQEEFDSALKCFGIVEHDNICDKCVHHYDKDSGECCGMAAWWKYIKYCKFYEEVTNEL